MENKCLHYCSVTCNMRPCCEAQGVKCCGECFHFGNCTSRCLVAQAKEKKEDKST